MRLHNNHTLPFRAIAMAVVLCAVVGIAIAGGGSAFAETKSPAGEPRGQDQPRPLGQGCSGDPDPVGSLSVTTVRNTNVGGNHHATVHWTDTTNDSACMRGYLIYVQWGVWEPVDGDRKVYKQYERGYTPDRTARSQSWEPADMTPYPYAGVFRVFIYSWYTSGKTSQPVFVNYIHPEPDEEEVAPPPWPPSIEYNHRNQTTQDWSCDRTEGCSAQYTMRFVDPGHSSQTGSDNFGYRVENQTRSSLSVGRDESNGIVTSSTSATTDLHAGTVVRVRAKREVSDVWSSWSGYRTRRPMPTQSQARSLPKPDAPPNFSASYVSEDGGNKYRLEFDRLKPWGASDSNWSGGLPVLRYQWGWVEPGTSINSSTGCPYSDFPSGRSFSPPNHPDRYSIVVHTGPVWKLAIQAVTLAGAGKCSIVDPTGDPVSPPGLTFERLSQPWECIREVGCRFFYSVNRQDPERETASDGFWELQGRIDSVWFPNPDAPSDSEAGESNEGLGIYGYPGVEQRYRAQRRVGGVLSDWSRWFTLDVPWPTPEEAADLPRPAPPPNFSATYVPNNGEYPSYQLRFDGLKARGADGGDIDAEHWSGGLPVIRYEFGNVPDRNPGFGTDNCPGNFGNLAFRLYYPPERDTHTFTRDLPEITDRMALRAVTLAGNGNCTIVNAVGNPERGQDSEPTNTPATGQPAITGYAEVGETLTVSTDQIADVNGVQNAAYSYQWSRYDGTATTAISGATATTYTLQSEDLDRQVSVTVSFTDDDGFEESLTSNSVHVRPTSPLYGGFDSGTVPEAHNGEDAFTVRISFSEEPELSGADVRDHVLTVTNGDVTSASQTTPGENISWTVTVEPDGNADVTVELPPTTDCSDDGAVCTGSGKMLFNGSSVTVAGPASRGVQVENNPATGLPAIAGTAQVGETLTASSSGIADADGLDDATFTYQWLADDADIQGATNATYVLSAADAGKIIKVRVSFTDDAGNEEQLTSAATATVAAANNAATGAPTISGTVRVGFVLTAGTSGIADQDGLDNADFSYQWLADDVAISGATDITHLLKAAHKGKAIRVRVTFTDDAGNEESLTSAATGAVTTSPLTVSAENAAQTHDGQTAFTFDLRFSEEFFVSYKTLRDHAFTVTGGTVEVAKRLDGDSLTPNIRWRITVEPDGNADVTIVLPVTTDCSPDGAICTGDSRKLSNRLELTVSGPGP